MNSRRRCVGILMAVPELFALGAAFLLLGGKHLTAGGSYWKNP